MSDKIKVLVYGGTGAQGRPIVERLLADGFDVRILTRSGEGAQLPSGVETATGDLNDRDSLIAASAGCQRVSFMLPLAFDVPRAAEWAEAAINAAERARVDLFVYDTSAPVPDREVGVAAVDLKVRAEAIVRASDLPSIIVRPTIYMDNLAAPWSAPGIVADKVIAYPLPTDVSVSWISWADTAAFVSTALRRPDLAGRTFDLGGPAALDGADVAESFSRALGGAYTYAPIPLPAFEEGLNGAFGAPVGTEIAKLYGWFAGEGRNLLDVDVSAAILPLDVRPMSFESWIGQQDWQGAAAGSFPS